VDTKRKRKPAKPRVVGKPTLIHQKIKPYVADPIPVNDFKMPKRNHNLRSNEG
jgi:hypothetical protein